MYTRTLLSLDEPVIIQEYKYMQSSLYNNFKELKVEKSKVFIGIVLLKPNVFGRKGLNVTKELLISAE